MSIATKTGDDGSTALMYGRRVPKTDARVVAYGTCDELNAALGMVRAFCSEPLVSEAVLEIQKDLVTVMGELAVAAERDLIAPPQTAATGNIVAIPSGHVGMIVGSSRHQLHEQLKAFLAPCR